MSTTSARATDTNALSSLQQNLVKLDNKYMTKINTNTSHISALDSKVNQLSSAGLNRVIVEELPEFHEATISTIYMIPKEEADANNVYNEYIFTPGINTIYTAENSVTNFNYSGTWLDETGAPAEGIIGNNRIAVGPDHIESPFKFKCTAVSTEDNSDGTGVTLTFKAYEIDYEPDDFNNRYISETISFIHPVPSYDNYISQLISQHANDSKYVFEVEYTFGSATTDDDGNVISNTGNIAIAVKEPSFELIGDTSVDLTDYAKKDEIVGQKTIENGEIFNDYENNKAIANYSSASGYNTLAGSKVFIIQNGSGTVGGEGTYELDSTEGLEIDDVYSLYTDGNYENVGKIIAISNNTVTIDNYYNLKANSENHFRVLKKPLCGTTIVGTAANAEGYLTTAELACSHAEGYKTIAGGKYSHAEGYSTQSGYAAHAEGYSTEATNHAAHAEGWGTKALGRYSHSEGYLSETKGISAHAEGQRSTALGEGSHAEGVSTNANKYASHSEGYKTTADNNSAHAEGEETVASGKGSHTEGNKTEAKGFASHAEGRSTFAEGEAAHAEGVSTNANKYASHSEGYKTTASGDCSHSEGNQSSATAKAAHAEGILTTASNLYAHAEGENTTASGEASHAEGKGTKAEGYASHAEGQQTTASGDYSHAGGFYSQASNYASFAHGHYLKATADNQFVVGSTNETNNNALFIVGDGWRNSSSDMLRRNAFVVKNDGSAEVRTQGETNNSVVVNRTLNSLRNEITNNYATKKSLEQTQKDLDYFKENVNNGVSNVSDKTISVNTVYSVGHNLKVKVESKNTIPYPYTGIESGGTKIINGLTFTDNGDGSITLNGTTTKHTNFWLMRNDDPSKYVLKAGTYTFSGYPNDPNMDGKFLTVAFRYLEKTESGYVRNLVTLGSESNMTVNSVTLSKDAYIEECDFGSFEGITFDNFTIKPQLEPGSTATEFTPYTSDFSNVEVSRYGKNLMGYPFITSNTIINGVEFTDNSGIITANGTATSNVWFYVRNKDLVLPKGTYYLSGCPSGGTSTTYNMYVVAYDANDPTKEVGRWTDCGTGVAIDLPENNCILSVLIYILPNVTVENLTFKPQIAVGNTVTDYEPPIEPQTAIANADGIVKGLTSVSPNMTLFSNAKNIAINCEYLNPTYKGVNFHINNCVTDAKKEMKDYVDSATNRLDNVLKDILALIRSGELNTQTVSAIEESITSYLENKTVGEVEVQ